MIVISEEHKTMIKEIQTPHNYNSKGFKDFITILSNYYPQEPTILGKRLLLKLIQGWANKPNEAIVHYWTLCRLINEYKFPAEQIDLEVPCGGIGRRALSAESQTSADIVVYSHHSRRPGTALIAIECRELNGVNGAKQAASYARALYCKYHLFTDSGLWDAFETQPHPVDGLKISDIPLWVGTKPLSKKLSKSLVLPPITDERQLRDLVKICHDKIHAEGVDPATAFDELVKLFFVKVYDEQEIPDEYQFCIIAEESPQDTGLRIRELLNLATNESRYKKLFSEPGDNEFSISNSAICTVVETFQGFSFTGNSLIGIDAKGTVYENMVGSTFRGELGQYFTPRKIVEFCVDLLQPARNDKVLDPSCGSGGFLIYILRQVALKIRTQQQNLQQSQTERIIKQYIDENIFGTDISPRMVRATRMNMIMHGDGWSGVQRCNGLKIHRDDFYKNYVGKFTLMLSNPPFAGFETDEDVLSDGFEVGKNEAGNIRGVNKAIIFVEQIINLLAKGGRAGIVLPRSIFENESYSFRKLRQIIFEKCEILALIGLPRTAFHHTDCGILGDLLFIKKTDSPRKDYDVFISWAENVGYNSLGHNIEQNDFPQILDNYKTHNKDNMFSILKLKEIDNICPWTYHPHAETLRKNISSAMNKTVPLSKLVAIYKKRISRSRLRETPSRILKYVEVGDFDPQLGSFDYKELTINNLPSRATYEMYGEDLILLPNAKNSLESGRKIIKIGTEINGMILTNRFLPLHPKVNIDYLVMVLNTKFVRDQLIAVCKGAGAPDFRENKLNQIMIPVPDPDDYSSIDVFMEGISDKLAHKKVLENELSKMVDDIENAFDNIQS
jgi:type I restriction-modification system DNA methylase subunit